MPAASNPWPGEMGWCCWGPAVQAGDGWGAVGREAARQWNLFPFQHKGKPGEHQGCTGTEMFQTDGWSQRHCRAPGNLQGLKGLCHQSQCPEVGPSSSPDHLSHQEGSHVMGCKGRGVLELYRACGVLKWQSKGARGRSRVVIWGGAGMGE